MPEYDHGHRERFWGRGRNWVVTEPQDSWSLGNQRRPQSCPPPESYLMYMVAPPEVSPSLQRMLLGSAAIQEVPEDGESNNAMEVCTPEVDRVQMPTPIVRYTKDVPQEEYVIMDPLVDILAEWLDGNASLSLADDSVRRLSGVLRALCQRYRAVPKQYLIPSQSLGYSEMSSVARGRYAAVHKGKYTCPDGGSVDVAVKLFYAPAFEMSPDHRGHSILGKAIFNEIVLWQRLSQHPRMTKMIGVEQRPDGRLGIISEWMDNGSLSRYLGAHKKDSVLNRLQLILDICEGLQYLHSQRIAHTDIKSENILIDKNGRANLCDSGMPALMLRIRTCVPPQGPSSSARTPYLAPEFVDPQRYMLPYYHAPLSTDIYALGIVMWQVFSKHGKAPWSGVAYEAQIIEKTLNGQRPSRPKHPLAAEWGLTDAMWNLIERCWSYEWAQRPQVDEVLECVRAALIAFNGSRQC